VRIKEGTFGFSNPAASAAFIEALNLALDEERQGGCQQCTGASRPYAIANIERKRLRNQEKIVASASKLPLLSINNPQGWTYRSIGLVTAQTTTGTGLISELTTAWTDFFGQQSKVYNNKIRAGEDLCKTSLRLQTLALGGNAILGIDVDYAEVGGQRAMLMVCMTGTAVEISNIDEICPSLDLTAEEARTLSDEISRLDEALTTLSAGA
jgi:uncharacterized protein YbjQ (UPF0145 family)